MSKNKCNQCGTEFEYPATYEECVGEYWGFPAYQTYYVCPCCGSGDYEEIEDEE